MDERRGVALGGFMGVGKTTVGARLARLLGLPFVDTDALLAEAHGPIPEQLARDGEEVFRARERAVIARVTAGPPAVVATGGGAWADPANRELLRAWGRLVVLHAPLEVLRARLGDGAGRPLWARAEALLAARREAYADAELSFDSSAADPDAIAARIADAVTPPRVVRVAAARGDYDVHVRRALAGLGAAVADLARGRVIVITDDRVAPLWADAVEAELAAHRVASTRLTFPHGEASKHVDTWWRLVDGMLRAGVDRATPVVALGGGVVGDLAGFAAACTLRGLPVVQVPTTLLAMVDSSVGGKTGFNHEAGKNLVGAFHAPSLVWIATETLRTLPPRELRAGFGEVIKVALVDDGPLLDLLEREAGALGDLDLDLLAEVVARCVASKARVVGADERESGLRAILNAGHTVGHAIEAVAGYGEWLHGEAVGVGLVAELAWAERAGCCHERGLSARIVALLERLGLPSRLPDLDPRRLVAAMEVDKKAFGGMLSLPVVESVGRARLVSLPRESLLELLQ